MTPRWRSDLTGSEVYEADARLVAQTLPAGSVTCSILDGPYNCGKAEWDRVPRGGSLGDLYTGHLDDVGRLSAASASPPPPFRHRLVRRRPRPPSSSSTP